MKYSMHSLIGEVLQTERGRLLAARHLPGCEAFANAAFTSLGTVASSRPGGVAPTQVQALIDGLNAPLAEAAPELLQRPSLDALDEAAFFPDGRPAGPLDGEPERIALMPGRPDSLAEPRRAVQLDGEWQLTFDRDGAPDWSRAMSAPVPGSIHTALATAGVIPDTTFGRNQELARRYSYMDWWYRTAFPAHDLDAPCELVFDGACNRCEVYLNGALIGGHEGMFGGPTIDVTGMLRPKNELVVHLFAIPEHCPGQGPMDLPERRNLLNNDAWHDTVVFNNVYGWHYSCLPSLGIWRGARLSYLPDVALPSPFIATVDTQSAEMRLRVDFESETPWKGTLAGVIEPLNFKGEPLHFVREVDNERSLLLGFHVPAAKLWWPNGLGEQNLYQLTLSVAPDGATGERVETSFGVRTVAMAPLEDGPTPALYNWRFIINGRPAFIRGSGWCTMDAMMDFSRARYDRFLSLAHIQRCQMLRAWGGGMPETDDFYALCDRYGIMVMQEWPTAWDSHLTQPLEMLDETVRLNTLRIRNHPSLILWCPGNESANPFGEAIDCMAHRAVALDGTRSFHRGEPWGGSVHNYDSYWGRQPMDVHVNLEGAFFGEFGIACTPCAESVNRYLPEAEKNQWPVVPYSAFEYHTPIFGTAQDLSRLEQMVGYFAGPGCTFEQMTVASQLSQIVGVRHTLERARFRYPYCGGALYYKLNDNFPAMSWATVDWYGAPKLAHYVFRQSFAPTAAFVLPRILNFSGTEHSLPLVIADDFGEPGQRYTLRARAFDGALRLIAEQRIDCEGDFSVPDTVGRITIPFDRAEVPPVLVRVELDRGGQRVSDTFCFFNYEARRGCLFELPVTALSLATCGGTATVTNVGDRPAVGVTIQRPGHAHSFTAEDGFFWLDPGESRSVRVNCTNGLTTSALNAGAAEGGGRQ